MFEKLESLQRRIEEINTALAEPDIVKDHRRMTALSKELSEIRPVWETFAAWKKAGQDLEEALLLQDDPDLREMAREEVDKQRALRESLETHLKLLLLPKDPYEGRNVILEIRAGTGGDEAALFAGDLFRMYTHYCLSKGWKMDVFSRSEIAVGGSAGKGSVGFKEVLCTVSGEAAYNLLRFESGVHRVQRVPITEAQGRIHTSAATVAILPEADAVEVQINPSDLRIDVFRAGGPGGQSVNTTDSAVRVTHIPSGLVVICQDEKSQHKNKARALQVLAARLLQKQEEEQAAQEAANRRAQVGTGDRSERIRTYNFPQNRLSDHRINLTLYKLDRIIAGELDEVTEALQSAWQAEQLAAQGAET